MTGPEGGTPENPLNIDQIVAQKVEEIVAVRIAAHLAQAVEDINDYFDENTKRIRTEREKTQGWDAQVQHKGPTVRRRDQALRQLQAEEKQFQLGFEAVLQALGVCEKLPEIDQGKQG